MSGKQRRDGPRVPVWFADEVVEAYPTVRTPGPRSYPPATASTTTSTHSHNHPGWQHSQLLRTASPSERLTVSGECLRDLCFLYAQGQDQPKQHSGLVWIEQPAID